MRVDPFYITNLATSLDDSSYKLQQLTQELSSGLRVSTLSSDPLAAGQSSLLGSAISQQDTFVQVASSEQGRLQAVDGTLGEVVTQITRALTLGVEGSNDTLNATNRASIANEVSGIRDTVLSLANTSYTGTYLFSGSKGTTKPFSLPTPTSVAYAGDGIAQSITTPAGQKIQVSLPGAAVFTPVLTALNQLAADLTTATPSAAVSADTAALTAALTNLSSQRSVLDNNLNRLNSTSTYAQTQSAELTVAQSTLVAADPANVATSLSTSEVQHQALINVIATLSKSNLFSVLQ